MNVREWALPVYTILMEIAIGALVVLWIIRSLLRSSFSPKEMDRIIRNPVLVIAFTAMAAMIGSHFHLSKPLHSFYAVLNFRSSWLSREILFNVLFLITTIGLWILTRYESRDNRLITGLGWLAILFGLVVVYCMARIYLLPTQVAWNSTSVIVSFYTTMLLLGVMTIACLMVLDLKFAEIQKTDDVEIHGRAIKQVIGWLALAATILTVVSISMTIYQLLLLEQGGKIAQTSLSLLLEVYLPLMLIQLTCLVVAPFWLVIAANRMHRSKSAPESLVTPIYISCLFILIGEIIGRFLFYATHIRMGL